MGKELDILRLCTPVEKETILFILSLHTVTPVHNNVHGCVHWKGRKTRKGYPRYSCTIKALPSRDVLVHRFVYFITHQHADDKDNMGVSHICHNKLCVNPYHLVLEPTGINNKRNLCVRKNTCTGHVNGIPCIL